MKKMKTQQQPFFERVIKQTATTTTFVQQQDKL